MTKAISLDNLAQFKAKCDETYAKVGEGGITLSQVIAREETLPTATADSPDFVQTPDGTLYRKKAVEGSSLLGTWVFNDTIDISKKVYFLVSFTSNQKSYTTISKEMGSPSDLLTYGGDKVYNGSWVNSAYKTIQITDTSSLTNGAEFRSWLTANATKTSGGAPVLYSYVALADA